MPIPKHDLDARVQAVLDEFEHPFMTDERLEAMQHAAQQEFERALRDRGTDPGGFELLVHIDELVGPMAFVAEVGGRKRQWPLPAFQAWLSEN